MIQTSLSDGQLTATTGTILAAQTVRSHIAQIFLTNTDTAAHTVNVYVRRSGSSANRRIAPLNYSISAGNSIRILQKTNELHLGVGDTILADADAASKIDYLICGALSDS